jgi:N-acetylglucosaminyldiphosphoundecaprenol N-acetyl-beta-D-mannosaminyltransferase
MQQNKIAILHMPVAVTSYDEVVPSVIGASSAGYGKYICVANVHMCMESYDNPEFCQVVYNADLVVPDGRPLVWALRLLGEKHAFQVRGSDLLLKLCAEAQQKNIPVGFYGGTPESLQDFQAYLKREYPLLPIACAISPPFRPLSVEEDAACVAQIIASGTKILFVGIGCPKQENWMAAHKNRLGCVMIGVGAAFDFFSGRKKHAPRWMQKAGLEWVFRLASDPRRLWKRYLKHNPRFVWYFLRQLWFEKWKSSSR